MNLFEKIFSLRKDKVPEKHLPEMPGVQPHLEEVPMTPETKHDQWEKNNPEGVREIISSINREEEDEQQREQIIDKIIEERDKKTH